MLMTKFNTQYRKPVRVLSVVGSPDKVDFKPKFDDRGRWKLEPAGTHSLYEEIQSHADSVDINILLMRFKNGDINALNRVQGIYGDFSNMPETYIDAVNQIEQGRLDFAQLPPAVKEAFNNSFEEFVAAMTMPDFMDRVHAAIGGNDEKKDDEVKSDAE